MPFKPGTSGNPKGRPRLKGTTNEEFRAHLRARLPEVLAVLIEKSLAGDLNAIKLLVGLTLPGLKAEEAPVTITLGTDLAEAPGRILAAVEAGTLTPSQAASLSTAVGNLVRASESLDFEQRLRALEADHHADRRPA